MSDESAAPVMASEAPSEAPEAPVEASEDEQDSQEGSEESKPAATKKKSSAPKFRKIKVGDEEISLSDEDIARDYKKWKGADSKFREAAEARAATERFMEQLMKDPEKVLSDPRLTIDREKLATKWLAEQIQAELNPPDPRDEKLTAAERRLKEYEDRERAEQEQAQQAEEHQKMEQSRQRIGETLQKAMESTHLSADPESAAATLREMALYMRAAKERGEDVTPEEIVEHIHNSRFRQFYSLANQFEGEDLIEFLGPEVLKRIRKADLARLKGARNPQQKSHRNESWGSSGDKPVKKMDAWEAKEHVRKMLAGK